MEVRSMANAGRCSFACVAWAGLLIAIAAPLRAQTFTPWRFWTVADGLPESNTSWLEPGPQGSMWAKHGVSTLTRLDGYSVTAAPGGGQGGRLAVGRDGTVWILRGRNLSLLRAGRWQAWDIPELGPVVSTKLRSNETNAFAPLDSTRALLMLPDRLLEFDSVTRTSRVFAAADSTALKTFTAIRQGHNANIWVTGKTGIGQIDLGQTGAGTLQFRSFRSPAGIENLSEPHEGEDGEVFAAAFQGGKPVVVRFAEQGWTVVYKGQSDYLQAWRGADGDIWVGDGNRVLRLSGKGNEMVPRDDALAGIVQNSYADDRGVFWVATSQGIARYAPPLWRTPPSLRDPALDDLVNAICEDRDGVVWFLGAHFLIGFDGHVWSRYPIPAGFRLDAVVTAGMALSPDGNLVIATGSPDMLVFHPGTRKFDRYRHPGGRIIRMFGQLRNGELAVQTIDRADTEGFAVETFDGRAMRPWFNPGHTLGFWDVRSLYQTSDRTLWLGSVTGVATYVDGRLKRLGAGNGAAKGSAEDNAFTFYEASPGHLLVGGRKFEQEFDGERWTTLGANLDRARSTARGPDGAIWIASGTGVHRLSKGAWITNDGADGLPSSVAYSVFADRRGRVWAGTIRGISLYHPDADTDPPRTVVPDDLNSRSIAPDGRVRIVFSGVDKWNFTEPSHLLFSYRADRGSWSRFAPETTAMFPAMKPGDHHFEARTMDRNGNIDPAGASFDFSVISPWYRQKGFLLLMVLGISVILYLVRAAWVYHNSLAFESKHDPLTKLFNRRAFESALKDAIGSAEASAAQLAVLFIDLDRFKPINDKLGHAAGDAFLQQIASRIHGCLGDGDVLARIGGDEFAIVLRSADARAAGENLAERILGQLLRPCQIGENDLTSSASIGIGIFPEHASDAATLQKLADVAMYHCKSHARGSYCIFQPYMASAALTAARVADLVRESIDYGYLRVQYQPIVRANGKIVALETLVRIDHPREGKFAPHEFIAIAEETGLIVALGQWVLNEACRQLAEWRAAGHPDLRITVNVSPVQLTQPGFAGAIAGSLARARLDPAALILEITETAMMNSWNEARTQIEDLRAAGVAIALDDFGTGYSSLNSLHSLPIDYVKIDRSFTWLIGEDFKGEAMLNGIIRMARQLGFIAVVEGIETPQQKAALIEAECDLFQGFLIGNPVDADETGRRLSVRAVSLSQLSRY